MFFLLNIYIYISNENIVDGIYLHLIEEEEVMFKCIKKRCKRLNENGIFVFKGEDSEDKLLMDDMELDELLGIRNISLKLYHCIDGVCTESSSGFIRYNGRESIVKYTKNDKPNTETTAFVSCSEGDTDGVIDNMDVCIEAGVTRTAMGDGAFKIDKLYQRTTINAIGVATQGRYVFVY